MAIEEIIMPQLGESVTEGTISKWFVSIGDTVNKYDPIAEIMTDKVTAEVPSSYTGKIEEFVALEGDTIEVGQVICRMEVEVKEEKYNSKSSVVSSNNEEGKTKEENIKSDSSQQKARFSPAVLKLSQEHGIDLNLVQGTGAGGRITRKDLLILIESGAIPKLIDKGDTAAISDEALHTQPQGNKIETQPSLAKETPIVSGDTGPGDVEIPVTGVRRSIAANMLRSKTEIPHAWTMVEVDVTNLVEYRNSIKEEFKKKEGFNLTFFAFFIKAVAQGLKEFPELNSMWAGDTIVQKKAINISIAVATDDALYVPVIMEADEKTIKGIAREIDEYAKKVRSGTLKLEDMQGGTFTVNNTGSFGSVQSMGIINYPQAAILQVESIVKRPVVVNNGMIAVRDMVNLCLSLDHRVLDGLICGRFLQRLKQILENMSKENTSLY